MPPAVARLLLLAWALACGACASVPKGRIAVDRLTIEGNHELGDAAIEQKLATRETPRFLGMFRGVLYDYELFNRYVLERDLQRIERYYRARGYYRARARAGRVFSTSRGHVRVEILVEEGPPVLTKRIDVHGLEGLPREIVDDAHDSLEDGLATGERFEEDEFKAAAERLQRVLTDNGYAYAKVQRAADVDLPNNAASVDFWVTPGRKARYGAIRIEGLGNIPEGPVRRTLDLTPGDPYSTAELEEAERALLNLGVFGSVRIEPDLPAELTDKPKSRDVAPEQGVERVAGKEAELPERVPIRVRLEPARLHSVHLGGGLQIDVIKTDVHLTAGWEDRNFLGGLRRFQVEAVPGGVLYPTRIPSFEKPDRLLLQARLRTELRQPGVIEARTNGFVRAEGSIYPVLLSAEHEADTPVLGYRDVRVGVGLDRSLWRFYGALSQNLQINSPFTYMGELDPDLNTAVVSYPELITSIDLRDDRVRPHTGVYVMNTLQLAGVGGDARDVKLQPEARAYLPLSESVTFGARGTVGFLFPDNYGSTLVPNAYYGTPGNASRETWVEDVQLLFLRGFFSGGNGSNRGYGAREIGPHGVVPFYNPGQSAAQLTTSCEVSSPDYSAASCDLPLGGLTLWEASVELRYPIAGSFSGAVFTDASDVSPHKVDLRFDRPHLSSGVGFRVDTPVGPIRADVGYRIPGLQAPDSPDEIEQPSELFGLPIAVSIGIGEAF